MNTSRWDRIASTFSRSDRTQPLGDRLCELVCNVLGTTMASIGMLTSNHYMPIAATNDRARRLIDQQFALGDGPAFEAARNKAPIFAPDLTSASAGARWPAFVPVALDLGAKAEFAFPLSVGAAVVGVLTTYQTTAATLEPDIVADAMVVATFATDVLVSLQAGSQELNELFSSDFTNGSEIHQAAGMVSEQLGISIVDALVRLRSHAYATNTPLSVVARNVIEGHFTLDP